MTDLGFTYTTTKDGLVRISHEGRPVVTLRGTRAQKFLQQIQGKDLEGAQLVMARFTGNFKRGNEKRPKRP